MRRPAPRRRVPFWLRLAPAVLLLAWGGNHFTPLLHLYEQVGHYAAWQANLLLGLYVGGLVPGLLVASAVADRRGRKPVLLAGVVLAVLGSVLLAGGVDAFVLLCVGRALAGGGVGVAMSVGTSWMKELSSPPFDPEAGPSAGAKRPSLTLTLGFGLGAAVTGTLAQWGPAPTVLPYVVHAALTVLAVVGVLTAPESLPRGARATAPLLADLRVPSAGHRTFTRLVVPAAPWVFAAAGIAYAIMPAVVDGALGRWGTIYATALTVLTLGTGAVVQGFVPRIDRRTHGGALVIGLALMTLGIVLAVVAADLAQPVLALAVAVVLGAAYGTCVVAGLLRVQAIATPRDLAGLTGLYYSLTYVGFLLPTVLAVALPIAPYVLSLAVVAVLCLVSLGVVAREGARRPA